MNYFRIHPVDRELRIVHHVIRDIWRNAGIDTDKLLAI